MGCCDCTDDVSIEMKSYKTKSTENGGDPVLVNERSCTDVMALIALIVVLEVFGFLFLSVFMQKSDIYRIINGYDDCANVCGRVTSKEANHVFSCKGADMTELPYLQISLDDNEVMSKTCVANCSSLPDHVIALNYCIPKKLPVKSVPISQTFEVLNFLHLAMRDVSIAWREIIYLLLIALAISLFILISFRYVVQYVIYFVLIGSIAICMGGTVCFWMMWYLERKYAAAGAHDSENDTVLYMICAILMSIVTVITILVVMVMRKRIALVSQLFREAGKAVYSMPSLLLQPIYTYLLVGLTMLAWFYCMLCIESAGDLYIDENNHLQYMPDSYVVIARWYNIFVLFVLCEFHMGCQHMVVAGAVARWFFTRKRSNLSMPVTRSLGTLIRYHLGTVAFGSLVIGCVRYIRLKLTFIHKKLKKYDNALVRGIFWFCQCCFWVLESALQFLTRNAYIETAIYGCSFYKSGKKAFHALSNNMLRVAAINSVGDFILFLGKVLVVALTVVAGVFLIQKKDGIQHPWVPIALAGIFALLVSHCFISVYEMVIDSIFICFCEDCAKNDGISKPYFMSRGLMEFVENSEKALRQLEETRRTAALRNKRV